MEKNEKIAKLWKVLEERYGRIKLEEGQSENMIKRTFIAALGDYTMKDLYWAAGEFIKANKYKSWPTEAHMLEYLSSCKKEAPHNALPAPDMDNKQKQVNFGNWYREWVVGWPAEIKELHGSMTERMVSRTIQFDGMLKQYMEQRPRLKEKLVDAPFYVKATYFYNDGGDREFYDWLVKGVGYVPVQGIKAAQSSQAIGGIVKNNQQNVGTH